MRMLSGVCEAGAVFLDEQIFAYKGDMYPLAHKVKVFWPIFQVDTMLLRGREIQVIIVKLRLGLVSPFTNWLYVGRCSYCTIFL